MIILILSITQLVCTLVILRIYLRSRNPVRVDDPEVSDFLSDMLTTMDGIETILRDIRDDIERNKS